MCVHGEGEGTSRNWSSDAYVLHGMSILKLFDSAAICASTCSHVNIEHCSPITMFMNRETIRFVWGFSRFSYPFLIWEIPAWFVCHYCTLIAYYYVFFSCFLNIFWQYFLFFFLFFLNRKCFLIVGLSSESILFNWMPQSNPKCGGISPLL